MKLKLPGNNIQLAALALGTAVMVGGCCTKDHGGSYSYYSSTPRGGTAQVSESQNNEAQSADLSQNSQNTVIPLYKEELRVGTRQVDDGTVRLRKVVKTETVNEPIQLRRETVVIDRQPAATGQIAQNEQAFQEKEAVIQLHHDEPVIQTEIVPDGQIVAQTKSETQQQNVQRQVRREEIRVEKPNNAEGLVTDNVSGSNENQPMGGAAEANEQSSGASVTAEAQAQPPQSYSQTTTTTTTTITDCNTLLSAPDPTTLDGRQVQFSSLKVDKVEDQGQLIVANDSQGRAIYIKAKGGNENLKSGDVITITGTVRRVSSEPTQGLLSERMTENLRGQKVYIEAVSVQPAQ